VLASGLPKRNRWTIPGQAGDRAPGRIQWLCPYVWPVQLTGRPMARVGSGPPWMWGQAYGAPLRSRSVWDVG
jgi:hypothetical protein